MFKQILLSLRGIVDYYFVLMVIAVGLFTLLVDSKRYRQKGYIKELKIVKIISYSYMIIGGLIFILLSMM